MLIVLDMRHVLDKLEPEKGDSYDTKKSKYNDFFVTSDMTGCDFDSEFFFYITTFSGWRWWCDISRSATDIYY